MKTAGVSFTEKMDDFMITSQCIKAAQRLSVSKHNGDYSHNNIDNISSNNNCTYFYNDIKLLTSKIIMTTDNTEYCLTLSSVKVSKSKHMH